MAAKQKSEAVVELRGDQVTGDDRLLEFYDRSLSAIDAAFGTVRNLTAETVPARPPAMSICGLRRCPSSFDLDDGES
jgi:hypothetical protein